MNLNRYFNIIPEQYRARFKNMMSVTSVVVVRGVSVVVAFIMNVLIARFFGAAGSGTYFLFRAWTQTFVGFGVGGMSHYVVRETSADIVQGKIARAWAFVSQLAWGCLFTGLLFALIVSLIPNSWTRNIINADGSSLILKASALGAAFLFGVNVFTSGLKSINMPRLAIFLESGLTPILGVVFLGGIFFLGKDIHINIFIFVLMATFVISLIVCWVIWLIKKPIVTSEEIQHGVKMSDFFNLSSSKIWLISTLNVLSSSMIYYFLPNFATTVEIGGIGVCLKIGSLLQGIVLTPLAAIYMPRFSGLFKEANFEQLGREFWKSVICGVLFYLPAAIFIFFFREQILKIFGDDFHNYQEYLVTYLVMLVLSAISMFGGGLLVSTNKESVVLGVSIANLITMPLVMVLGARTFDLFGLFFTYVAMSMLGSFVAFALAIKRLRSLLTH